MAEREDFTNRSIKWSFFIVLASEAKQSRVFTHLISSAILDTERILNRPRGFVYHGAIQENIPPIVVYRLMALWGHAV